MNEELKKKWVKGLRSRRYEQISGRLYGGTYNNKHGNKVVMCCALGVLNDLSGVGHWKDADGYVVEAEDEFVEESWYDLVGEKAYDESDFNAFVLRWDIYREEADVKLPVIEGFRGANYSEEVVAAIEDCFRVEEEFIHPKVAKVAGCRQDPVVTYKGQPWNLHDLNDIGVSFRTLSRLIEEQL